MRVLCTQLFDSTYTHPPHIFREEGVEGRLGGGSEKKLQRGTADEEDRERDEQVCK